MEEVSIVSQANVIAELVIQSSAHVLQLEEDGVQVKKGDTFPPDEIPGAGVEQGSGGEIANVEWMTCETFSIDRGKNQIEEFVQTWDFEHSWLHCINFLREDELEYDRRYIYEVRFSIPTRRTPIPRATASVYFNIDVSKIKPGHFPVAVYYQFETNGLIHRPGASLFRQQWLKDVIDNKVRLSEIVTF